MKLMDRKNGIAISETANPVGDSRLQAFGSGQQNLPLEDFEGKILRIAFYKFPSSSPKTFHFVQFLNKIDLSIYLSIHFSVCFGWVVSGFLTSALSHAGFLRISGALPVKTLLA